MIPSRLLVRCTLSLLSLALLVSCGPRAPRSPLEPLDRAARAVDDGSEKEDALALAAWHAWLVRGDPERAKGLAQRAIAGDRQAPWARLLLAELASREVALREEATQLLGLLERAPDHPLAQVAALRLRGIGGSSLVVDEVLLEAIPGILDRGGLALGAAADLRALHLRLEGRRDVDEALRLAQVAGRVGQITLTDPASPYSTLAFDSIQPDDAGGGRTLSLPLGALSLAPEPKRGDVSFAIADVRVPKAGRYLLHVETAASASVSLFLDDQLVLDRRATGAPQPTRLSREIELRQGLHRLAARIARGWGDGQLTLTLAPADGSDSPLVFTAGGGPGQRGPIKLGKVLTPAASVAGALEDVGVLAAWAGVLQGMGSDSAGVRRLLDGALGELPASLPLLQLRAESWGQDPTVPQRIQRDRAAADWQGVVEGDPSHRAGLLALARLHRQASRWDEAEDALRRAASLGGDPAPILVEQARLAAARGHGALASSLGQAAWEADPGGCAAGALALSAARRMGDVGARQRLVRDLASCPGGKRRLLQLHRDAGRMGEALALAKEVVRLAPTSSAAVEALAETQRAAGMPEEAAATLAGLEATWPTNPQLPRQRSAYLAAAGDELAAREARLRALELDGSDLSLLRIEAFERRQEILGKWDPDPFEAIRAFEAEGRSHDAPAVVLIDFVGIEVHGDGSQVERHHVLTKILDKRGVDRVGEVHVPEGAEILELRTIKEDGRILEPEMVAEKDTISMRGLEVGDYVESRFLVATQAREPALPGFSTPRFFFRTRDFPILDSLFVVRAPTSFELAVDVHGGAPSGEIHEEGGQQVFVARSRDNPAFIPEPHGVASQEILPWVQVGAGAGEKELACTVADRLATAYRSSAAVGAWARDAAAGASTPREAIDRVWTRLMEEIEGDGTWDAPASFILSAGRGNRAVLLHAALRSLGMEVAWVALRTFDQDPHAYRFPQVARLGKLVLVARPEPAAGWVWLDPSVRYGPVGEVAPEGQGMQGWVLPSRGLDCLPTSAPRQEPPPRRVSYRLELTPDGSLLGWATEQYAGFEGARARLALERMDEDGLRQVVEGSLARGFREVVLDEVRWEAAAGETTLTYGFQAATTRLGDRQLSLDLDWTQLHLGGRFLSVGVRKTPLLLATGDHVITVTELDLPQGAELLALPEAARERGDFGSFRRAVGVVGQKLVIRDVLRLERGRVLPADYPAFAGWATEVDRALDQRVELSLLPAGEEAPEPEGTKEAPPPAAPEEPED